MSKQALQMLMSVTLGVPYAQQSIWGGLWYVGFVLPKIITLRLVDRWLMTAGFTEKRFWPGPQDEEIKVPEGPPVMLFILIA
jgi:hypothetical protein